MLKLIQKIIGTKNERELKKMEPIVRRINKLEPSMKALSNEDFPRKTAEWKEQIQKGRSLDDVLPEAFALVRDVDSPFVRVIYDIYHQQITEGNIIPTVRENLPMIAHLHCAGHPGRHELQTGELDYKNIFAAIDGMGYTGACGIEYGPTMEPVESLRAFRRIYLGEENE